MNGEDSKVEYINAEILKSPIKMADWIVNHFKQGEYPIYEAGKDGKKEFIEMNGEQIPIVTGEYEKYSEVNEIADYLLTYCKYNGSEA